jgi:hypothetical protein
MVRGRQHEAVGAVRLLHKGEHRVQHTADLADIVLVAPTRPDRVELVEQIDAARLRDLIEQQAQLAGGLAEEAAEERFEADGEQGQMQLARKRRCGHGLAGTGGTDEQHVGGRRLAVIAKRRALLLLTHDAHQASPNLIRQDHAGERHLRIGAFDEALQLAAWTGQRDRSLSSGRTAGPLLVAGLLNETLQLVSVLSASMTRFLLVTLSKAELVGCSFERLLSPGAFNSLL